MDSQTQRTCILHEIAALQVILDGKGISYELPWPPDTLDAVPLVDLRQIAKVMRDLARTPLA